MWLKKLYGMNFCIISWLWRISYWISVYEGNVLGGVCILIMEWNDLWKKNVVEVMWLGGWNIDLFFVLLL